MSFMENFMQILTKIKEVIDKAFLVLTTVFFSITSVCVLVQIVARYIPAISAPWTDEMTRMFFLYTVMFGAPMAIKYHEYAAIDLIPDKMHGKGSTILFLFIYLVVMVVSGVAAVMSLTLFQASLTNLSTALRINMGFFNIAPLVTFSLTFMYSIVEIVLVATGRQTTKQEVL